MTRPTDGSQPGAPTVREIAVLAARLRDISARGRDVDPAEREQFLADKDDLIARITAAEPERASDGRATEERCGRHLRPGRVGGGDSRLPEQERREQLARWHAEAQAAGYGDGTNQAAGGEDHAGLERD